MSFPAALDVTDQHVVVCGTGSASLASITRLLDEGALVTAVGTEPGATVGDLAERGLIQLRDRDLISDDLDGCTLLILATGDRSADASAQHLARARGILTVASPHPSTTDDERPRSPGRVILVGGGPGDPGLLTVAGQDALARADVIVCDRLAPLAALSQARPDATIIDVAKIPRGGFTPQERINELLIHHAQAGATVVRFKGGDNFVFGRGGEEWQACSAAGIPVSVIPGVSSAIAGPGLAGIPLTHRQLTQGFTVVSGHLPPRDPGSTLDWGALARANTTLVIMMGVATLPAITAELITQGMGSETPAMTVADAGLPSQRQVFGTVADIAGRGAEAGIKAPAISVIGQVAGLRLGG